LFIIYRMSNLNGTNIKHYVPSTIKCIGKIHFQTMEFAVSYAVRSQYGQHTSRWNSVCHQILARILLVMQSVVLIILSCFALFHNKHLLQTPRRKDPEKSNLENYDARGWVPFPLSNDQETHVQKGSSTIGKVMRCTIRWKTVLTGTRCKAVFSVIAREVSPTTIGPSKRKRLITVFRQSAIHTKLRQVMLMIINIVRIFTSPYMTIVLIDCYTHMKCCLISLSR